MRVEASVNPLPPRALRRITDPRAVAASAIAQVLGSGRSLAAILPDQLRGIADPCDRALAQELIYGVLRWLPRLELIIERLMTRSLRTRDRVVHALLLIGIHQLAHLRVPAHAAVSATVEASRALSRPRATALINAVLRGFLARRDEMEDCTVCETARWAHPAWLLTEIKSAWPARWEAIACANNAHPPMTLRVNARRCTRADYLAALVAAGIGARPVPVCPYGVTLTHALDPVRLPGFENGWISVQDAGAQLAAELLDARPGQRVLDACAAPGGKAGHIAEIYPELGEIWAVDKDLRRLVALRASLKRLRLHAEVRCADVADSARWWDHRPFDRILLDAPCSGTGVLRRHPDIKALRRPSDIAVMAQTQRRLLEGLWPLLREGGLILYVTCSILPAENQRLIQAFMRDHRDCQLLRIDLPFGIDTGAGTQILPGNLDMDGFFYARLAKGAVDA